MKINQDKIELLLALESGSLTGKEKKALIAEMQQDTDLADMYDLLKRISTISGHGSKPIVSATQKLSQKLFQDFQKNQASHKVPYGIQLFDSSLLPLPEGIRPASVDTRQLKYQIGLAFVELTMYPITVDSVELIGQINCLESFEGLSMTIETNGKSKNVPVDKFGLFRFERVATGNSSLYLKKGNTNEGLIELIL